MSAIIKDLEQYRYTPEGEKITEKVYPATVVQAVYMPDVKTTLYDELQEIKNGTAKTEFLADGSIKKTLGSGKISITTFGDGVITERCTYADGSLYYTKTTTFNADGSIDVEMIFAGEE